MVSLSDGLGVSGDDVETILGLLPKAGLEAASASLRKLANLQELQWNVNSLGLPSLNIPILTSTCDLDGLE